MASPAGRVVKGIAWESKEAVQLADSLYEKISQLTIKSKGTAGKRKKELTHCLKEVTGRQGHYLLKSVAI